MIGSRSLALARSSRSARVALAVGALSALVGADQILRVWGEALTNYKASATPVQKVEPLPEQRGVNLDGSLRLPATLPIAIAGNPFGANWAPHGDFGGIRLDTGTWQPTEVDIELPAPGFSWVIGRSYNARQASPTSPVVSDGYQGKNWFQMSQPEIVLHEDSEDGALDVLYLVYGADRYVEYQRTSSTASTYRGTNGAAGVFEHVTNGTNEPDTWELTDQVGNVVKFLGFTATSSPAEGQLWQMINPAGDTAYVGSTDLSRVVADGFDSAGRIEVAYDPADRRFTYEYSPATIGGSLRLEKVVVEAKDGGSWAGTPSNQREVAHVEYGYYPDSPSLAEGEPGDLRTVTLTTPLSDAATVSDVRTKHYRYYEGTYNATTNPGYSHMLKVVLGYEGARIYLEKEGDYLSNSIDAGDLKPFSEAFFEYDTARRISKAALKGSGTCTFTYSDTAGSATTYGSNSAAYDSGAVRRTTVAMPSYQYAPTSSTLTPWTTQYFDETGQCLSCVAHNGDPAGSTAPTSWVDLVARNSGGVVVVHGTPASVTSYTHGTTVSGSTISASGTAGLVVRYEAVASGDLAGLLSYSQFQSGHGDGQTKTVLRSVDYTTFTKEIGSTGGPNVTRPLISEFKNYSETTSTPNSTSALTISYTSYGPPLELSVETATATFPVVNSANHGSGSTTQRSIHYLTDGSLDFEMDQAGAVTYHGYAVGIPSVLIRDANTSLSGSGQDFEGITVPTGFESTGDRLHEKRIDVYDDQFRLTLTTLHAHDAGNARSRLTYYTNLSDGRRVTLQFPKVVTGSPNATYYGPVSFAVTNWAGNTEAEGAIALSGGSVSLADPSSFIDESQSDLLGAVGVGAIAHLETYHYDTTGTRLQSQRSYFLIPTSALPGTAGTNYDETTFAYDEAGRLVRSSTPHASSASHQTVTRLEYGVRGERIATWVGTNDSGYTGGATSGTANMVKISETTIDANGYVTKRTDCVQDSTTDQREVSYTNDIRGQPIVVQEPAAPHILHAFDNRGRLTGIAALSSISGLGAGSDPLATSLSNRLAAAKIEYDELGRAFRGIRYKVDPSDGSLDDSLVADLWYDARGRLLKVDGEQLKKFAYDRLGRPTHEFVLASDDDSAFGDVDDVTGDIVLEEHETAYDTRGLPVLRVGLSRIYVAAGAGQPTGALDSNADGDAMTLTTGDIIAMTIGGQSTPVGRVQIKSNWFDTLDRLENTADYGTNHATDNVATFDRDGLSVPARSGTVLLTSLVYNMDGTLKEAVDPRDLVTRIEYDALGRVTSRIGNYTGSGTTPTPCQTTDENNYVRFVYEDGLLTKRWVDFNGDGTVDATGDPKDQVTEYVYGTTKGSGLGSSRIATGHLLQKEIYPDSAGSSDAVFYAYDAQEAMIYKKDQSGNEFVYDYDLMGRETAERVATLASGYDDAVRRIETAYDALGRVGTVTQYDAATSGNETDQVEYTYDDWGNMTRFRQDADSAIGTGTYWDVSYAYAKATSGRNTLRR
ncbi:MAG: hypothetical protein Q8K63_04260, partial [Acidimicrobiales bacterium]|nr:hypothetical protein [Acidimicrobiales bacterium]